MSISSSPPVSLYAVRNNFEKSGSIGTGDRYVRDFKQLDEGEQWDLLGYAGQAYGLQYKIFNDGYGGGLSGGKLPLDEIDRRSDGAAMYPGADWASYALVGEDDSGKYAELQVFQAGERNPGSMAMNGIFFANDVGPSSLYRIRATVETKDDFSPYGEAGVFVFGYRYGYLDGDRVTYSLSGYGERPGPNQTITVDQTFTVDESYRHVVINLSAWLPGAGDSSQRAGFKVRDLTIERV